MNELDNIISLSARCISNTDSTISKLRTKIHEIDEFKKKCCAAKTGATVGAGICYALAPFTGGFSAILALTATGYTLAVYTITDLIDSSETKDFIRDIERFNDEGRKDSEELQKKLNQINDRVQALQRSGLSEAEAVARAFLALAGITLQAGGFVLPSGRFIPNLVTGMGVTVATNLLGSVTRNMAQLTGSLRVMRFARTAFRTVATAVFVVVDVVMLINEWKSEHRAASYASKIVSDLRNYLDKLKEIKSELEQLRDVINEAGLYLLHSLSMHIL